MNTVVTCGREPTVSRKEPSEGPVDRFYGRPDLFVDFPGNFGRITGASAAGGGSDPRILQLALRVWF